MAETVSAAASICEKIASRVFFARGLGTSRKSTLVIMPRVPSEPMKTSFIE